MNYKNNHTLPFALGLVMLCALARPTRADSCTYINTPDQYDSYWMGAPNGWQCDQAYINYWWDAFDFDVGDWDDGFGYGDPCNNTMPLARTFNAMFALGYASTGSPTCNTNGLNITSWSLCWAAANTDEVDGRCGSGSASGNTATGVGEQLPPGDCYTELYWPFFYGTNVIGRAMVLFHEARHTGAGGCGHNGGSSCPNGGSCDKTWTNGCSEFTNGQGANRYGIQWLESYAVFGTRITTPMRNSAIARGNQYLMARFQTDPCKRMNVAGFIVAGGC